MWKVLTAFFMSLSTLLMANIVDLWKNVEYHAFRITIEISITPKMRYEEVFRWKGSKFVRVFVPVEVSWYRSKDGTWSGRGRLKKLPINLLDLEDIALREVEKTSPKIEEQDWGFLIKFSTSKGDFEIWLRHNGIPLKIDRKFHDIEMKMIYESWDSPPPKPDSVLKNYEFSNELAFPVEIGRALSCLDWFYISREDGMMVVKGISHGKWVELEISPRKIRGAIKIGTVYFKTSDERILKTLMGER